MIFWMFLYFEVFCLIQEYFMEICLMAELWFINDYIVVLVDRGDSTIHGVA